MYSVGKVKMFCAFIFFLLFAVYIFPVPPRGTPGDLWADRILGQTDGSIPDSGFGELKPNMGTNRNVFNVGGVLVDRYSNPQRLYLWDGGNSRVLGFSDIRIALTKLGGQLGVDLCLGSDPTAVPMGADMVIGQPDFTHCACNRDNNVQNYPSFTLAGAATLCGMLQTQCSPWEGGSYSNMAVDQQGNLYVPDTWNNRVLRFESNSLVPGAAGPAASYVWGQSDFTGINANQGYSAPNNSTLSFGSICGAAVDSLGNLWVADSQNNRVLRFPNPNAPNPGVPLQEADIVLGQANFNTVTAALDVSDLNHLNSPVAVRVDTSGDVFVSDLAVNGSTTGRVLIYKPVSVTAGIPQYSSGMSASMVISSGVATPYSIDIDAQGNLWVTETLYNQVVMYSVNCVTDPPTAVAQKVLLQNQLSTAQSTNATWGNGLDFKYIYPAGATGASWFMFGPVAASVDKDGNIFVCAHSNMHDLYRFPAGVPNITALPAGQAWSADVDVFKPSQFGMKNQIGSANLEEGVGVAVGQNMSPQQIVASDDYRIMYWDIPAGGVQGIINGQAPDGYAGVTASNVFQMGTTIFGRVRTDNMTAPQHLWAIAYEQTAYDVQVYNLPLTPYAVPVTKVANTLPVLGGGSVTIPTIAGIYPDPAGAYLWIADNTNSRVLRVKNPLTAPVVDIILGQVSYTGTACNQGGSPNASTLCNPGSVEMDHHGNLYVSDASLETAGNWRMLRWTAAQLPANPATCLYGIAATGVFATGGNFNIAQSCVPAGSPPIAECAPFEPAFTSDDRIMVAGQNGYTGNRFPVAFSNPSGGDLPVSMLNDFSSMSYSAVFDNQDNLYITDLDRARMMIYFKPFPTPTLTPLTPMPTATFTCLPTPGCFQMGQNLPDQSGGFSYPMGVAVDTIRHYIYAADSGNNRIQLYSYVPGSQPVPAGVFGSAGAGNVQFNYINSIVTDSQGYLYVADFNNGRVQKIWFDGVNATLIAVVNQPADDIGLPRGLYVTPDGSTVYITTDANLVYRYDGGGAVYSKTASFGSGLNLPMGILKTGNIIYVVDNGNNKIEYFTETPGSPPTYSAGTAVNTGAGASLMNNMFFMTADKAGYIYVASANSFQMLVFQKMAVDTFYLVYNTSISNTPIAVAVDDQDDIYVSNGSGNKVVEVRGCFTENTATISPTITDTPTNTPTFTVTPTATCTSTYTSSATPSFTQTAFTYTYTPTSTATLTPAATLTATETSTQVELPPCGDGSNAVLYPVPFRSSYGSLYLHLGLCFAADVNVKIYTAGFRKIMDNTYNDVPIDSGLEIHSGDIRNGAKLASGIYYAAVIITPKPGSGFSVKKKVIPFVVIN